MRVRRPSERRSASRSAARALDVLECFGEARHPLRAVDIARALGLHASTTDQLLKTMVDSAHLIFEARGKTYAPSHRLAPFSGWMVERTGLDARLGALVAGLQDDTGELATLTTPNDLFMQVIDLAGVPGAGRATERGLRISIFGSAVGAAYLSTLDDESVGRLARRARLPASEEAEVKASIRAIRRVGFAEAASLDGRTWSLATPLAPSGVPPLVLGLAGPIERVRGASSVLQSAMTAAVSRWRAEPV